MPESDDKPHPAAASDGGAAGGQPTTKDGPPSEMKGTEVAPSLRRGIGPYVIAEFAIYALVGFLLLVALFVNIAVAYYGAGTALVTRFAADAEFILAASAVMLFAFEIRKEGRVRSVNRER
jgi:hypothetical protein